MAGLQNNYIVARWFVNGNWCDAYIAEVIADLGIKIYLSFYTDLDYFAVTNNETFLHIYGLSCHYHQNALQSIVIIKCKKDKILLGDQLRQFRTERVLNLE